MDPQILNICRRTKRAGNKQLMLFTRILRNNLLNSGVDQKIVDQELQKALKEFRNSQTYDQDCIEALKDISQLSLVKEKRGIDSVGRILVEYCFIRVPKQKLIWPENSEADTQARITFTQGVIPRPLMRYFLISVRGTIPSLDKFNAPSVLFGEENTTQEARKAYVDELIRQFRIDNGTKVDWNKVYSDNRFINVALDMIGEIRRKVEQFGLERYLRILDNLQQRDPANIRKNTMERKFHLNDVKQIDDALWKAEESLAQIIE